MIALGAKTIKRPPPGLSQTRGPICHNPRWAAPQLPLQDEITRLHKRRAVHENLQVGDTVAIAISLNDERILP